MEMEYKGCADHHSEKAVCDCDLVITHRQRQCPHLLRNHDPRRRVADVVKPDTSCKITLTATVAAHGTVLLQTSRYVIIRPNFP